MVWAQGDDALDIDQAYSGTIDNAVVVLGANSDHAFEIDGPEGSATGLFTLRNATIIGNSITENGEYAMARSMQKKPAEANGKGWCASVPWKRRPWKRWWGIRSRKPIPRSWKRIGTIRKNPCITIAALRLTTYL